MKTLLVLLVVLTTPLLLANTPGAGDQTSVRGPTTLSLIDVCQLEISAGYVFLPGRDSKTHVGGAQTPPSLYHLGTIRKDNAKWQVRITFAPKLNPAYVDTFRLSAPKAILFKDMVAKRGLSAEIIESDQFDPYTMSLTYAARLSDTLGLGANFIGGGGLPVMPQPAPLVVLRTKMFLTNNGIVTFELFTSDREFKTANQDFTKLLSTFTFSPGEKPMFVQRPDALANTRSNSAGNSRKAPILGPTSLVIDDTATLFIPSGYRYWPAIEATQAGPSRSVPVTILGSLHGTSLSWALTLSTGDFVPNRNITFLLPGTKALHYREFMEKLGLVVEIIQNDRYDPRHNAVSYVVETRDSMLMPRWITQFSGLATRRRITEFSGLTTRRRITEFSGRHKQIVAELIAPQHEFGSADQECQQVLATFNFKPGEEPLFQDPVLIQVWKHGSRLFVFGLLGFFAGTLIANIRNRMRHAATAA